MTGTEIAPGAVAVALRTLGGQLVNGAAVGDASRLFLAAECAELEADLGRSVVDDTPEAHSSSDVLELLELTGGQLAGDSATRELGEALIDLVRQVRTL